MRIRLLGIGPSRTPFIREGEKEYLNRISRYMPIQTEWIRPPIREKKENPLLERKKEAGLLVPRLSECMDVALDVKGESADSEAFARRLATWRDTAIQEVCFVIGGPYGLDALVLHRCQWRLSLSKMTLTHELVRLVLLEQIYRACTILMGEGYHK